MYADEVNNILWLGHMDGKVSGFVLGPTPGSPINSQLVHQWQVSDILPYCLVLMLGLGRRIIFMSPLCEDV